MIIIPPFSAPVFGKLNTSTVCEKHKQVAKDNAIFILIVTRKNNFFFGMNLFFNIFFRLSTGMVGTDSWS